jgi:hypothetical protein
MRTSVGSEALMPLVQRQEDERWHHNASHYLEMADMAERPWAGRIGMVDHFASRECRSCGASTHFLICGADFGPRLGYSLPAKAEQTKYRLGLRTAE